MSDAKVTRRLAAILAVDMVGFSRLMARDEAGTIARQKAQRAAVFDPKIACHGGRIVKTMGDGLLVEFASVVDAASCALEIQRALAAEASEPEPIRHRMGLNLGDIMLDGEDILGDGVNVAARLEALAPPGGLCLSDMVVQNLQAKLELNLEDMGEQVLKNIERKVRVWRWAPEGDSAGQGSGAGPRGLAEELAVPDKPSIVVLPFANLSGDPEQDYFSDGVTEDIITELARFKTLFVIARTSAFTYKGRALDVRQVGRELGVRYVVEGSVRKAGPRVRITVQLIEAESGNHIWAERYDRQLEDVFDVQDEITRRVTGALGSRVEAAGMARARQGTPEGLAAYDLVLRAKHLHLEFSKQTVAEARDCLEQALRLSPDDPTIHSMLALGHLIDWMGFWLEDRAASFQKMYDHATQAVRLDPDFGRARCQLGEILHFRRAFEDAERQFEKGLSLNPNDAEGRCLYGLYLAAVGRAEEGVAQYEEAKRLDPFDQNWRPWLYGAVLFTARRYDEAIATLSQVRQPINEVRGWLAASYGHAGRRDEARHALAAFLEHAEEDMVRFPGRRLTDWQDYWHSAMEYRDQADFEHLYDGLRKAGMSD